MKRLDRIVLLLAWAGVAMLGVAALLGGIDIATRRTLRSGVAGAVDLTQWLVMACAFACIPLAFLRQAQVEVDFVASRFAPRPQALLRSLGALVAMVFMALVTLATAQAAWQVGQRGDLSPTLGWPMAGYWWPVVLGSALSTLACAALAWAGWPRRGATVPG